MSRNRNSFQDFVYNHAQLVMPIVLVVCCIVTAIIGLVAHRVNPHAQAAQEAAEAATEAATEEIVLTTLQQNAYPDINNLFETYYQAMADGDTDTIESISSGLSDQEKIRIEELSKYVDSYSDINVYTQQGPIDHSFICYVYSKMKFIDHDWEVPGMQTMYVCTRDDGTLYINNTQNQDREVTDFIQQAAMEDDVVDLTNQVTAEYNELLASNQELSDYLNQLSSDIDLSVGQALANLNATESAEASTEASTESADTENVTYVTATDTVNVRQQPDESAEILTVTRAGDRFEYVQDAGDGWYEIIYNGQNAYVRSEYFTMDE